jgi:hypothetical protein
MGQSEAIACARRCKVIPVNKVADKNNRKKLEGQGGGEGPEKKLMLRFDEDFQVAECQIADRQNVDFWKNVILFDILVVQHFVTSTMCQVDNMEVDIFAADNLAFSNLEVVKITYIVPNGSRDRIPPWRGVVRWLFN